MLSFEPLFVDRFMAIVPADSDPEARRSSVSWTQLLTHDFITLQRPSSMRRLLEDSLATKGIELRVALECHQLATVGQLVAAGLGVSVVPSLCQRQMSALGVCCLPVQRPSVRKAVGLITRRDQQLSTAARTAIRASVRDVADLRARTFA